MIWCQQIDENLPSIDSESAIISKLAESRINYKLNSLASNGEEERISRFALASEFEEIEELAEEENLQSSKNLNTGESNGRKWRKTITPENSNKRRSLQNFTSNIFEVKMSQVKEFQSGDSMALKDQNGPQNIHQKAIKAFKSSENMDKKPPARYFHQRHLSSYSSNQASVSLGPFKENRKRHSEPRRSITKNKTEVSKSTEVKKKLFQNIRNKNVPRLSFGETSSSFMKNKTFLKKSQISSFKTQTQENIRKSVEKPKRILNLTEKTKLKKDFAVSRDISVEKWSKLWLTKKQKN